MEDTTVNEGTRARSGTADGGVPRPGGRGRIIAVVLMVAVAVAVLAVFGLLRKRPAGPPGWVAGPVPAPTVVAEVEASARRLLERDATVLAAAAGRAGRVPGFAALLTSSLDGAAFQDALANEPWWKEFRSYGCAVVVGDDVKAVWHLPGSGLPPLELVRKAEAAPGSAGARVIAGPNGFVLGASASIDGVKGARLLLTEGLDRQHVATLAARANAVMMLSDGQRDLGASLPDALVPQLEGLVGHEASHVMVERHISQLAVAVPWTSGLWLWVVNPWQP